MPETFRPYLIQRLKKPTGYAETPLSPVLGNHQKLRENIAELFTFDYMGSSEFEWGAIPKALTKLIKKSPELQAFEHEVIVEPTPWQLQGFRQDIQRVPSWLETKEEISEHTQTAKKDFDLYAQMRIVPVYILSSAAHTNDVKAFIDDIAVDEYDGTRRCKELTHFQSSLAGPAGSRSTVGWFDLENSFMFFTDYGMLARTAQSLGVQHNITEVSQGHNQPSPDSAQGRPEHGLPTDPAIRAAASERKAES